MVLKTMQITDFHTHAFPDALAEKAIRILEAEVDDVHACLPGTVNALLESMDRCGVARSVLCSIATRPEQFGPIMTWSRDIACDRLVPFPSVHPADPRAATRVSEIAQGGFAGIKLHPYYQQCDIDAPVMWPIYDAIVDAGLILICHTGYDIAFPRYRRADPERVHNVLARYPDMVFIATHTGAWRDWREVEKWLIGSPAYIDVSYSMESLRPNEAARLLARHDRSRILFGSDSPWQDQGDTIAWIKSLGLGDAFDRAVLSDNAGRLLGAV